MHHVGSATLTVNLTLYVREVWHEMRLLAWPDPTLDYEMSIQGILLTFT